MMVQHMDGFKASAARDGRQELPRFLNLDAHVSRDRGTDLSVSDQHRAGSENPGESSVGMAFQQAGNKGRQRYWPVLADRLTRHPEWSRSMARSGTVTCPLADAWSGESTTTDILCSLRCVVPRA